MDSRLQVLLLLASAFSFSSCLAQSNLISGRKGLRDQLVDSVPLSYSNHSGRIDPTRVVQISWRPRVFLYKGFLSDEECDHLISLASNSEDKPAGNTVSNKSLNSSGAILNTTDDIIGRIEDRIAVWTFLSKDHSMPLQIMQYRGEEAEHKYVFGNKSTMSSTEPLMATVVLYLSDSTSGGEMLFPESKVKKKFWSKRREKSKILRPVKGNAILFFSVHLNASSDKSSYHTRSPILDGELWVATKFFYLRPTATGNRHTVEYDRDDCTDEDKSCPRWAAIGECERNAVFMIGSPDYYGTDRKSVV